MSQLWIVAKDRKRYVILGKDKEDVKALLRTHLRLSRLRGFEFIWLSNDSRGVLTEYCLDDKTQGGKNET